MQVKLKNVRIAFPAVFSPQAYGDGNPAYGGKLIIEPGSANHKALVDAMSTEAKTMWKDKADAVLKILKQDKRVAYVEAPYTNKDGEIYDGFDGMFSLSCRSEKTRPNVFNRDGVTQVTEADGLIYSGCIVNAFVDLYAFDSPKWGRRINCVLTGIQYAAPGQAFGGSAPVAPGAFDAIDDEDDFV
ncbi:MAG: ssDNA-binding protein [Alphaproteobacteria bacterium]